MTKVTLGMGLAKIGINAFFQCKSLVEIIIPPAVKVIGIKAFVAAKVSRGWCSIMKLKS